MELTPQPATDGRLIITPHPVLLDGQRNVPVDLRPGESLYAFLMRHIDGLDGQAWQVCVDGIDVPREQWMQVRPRHGQLIEVRSVVGKAVIPLVAMIALTYFTFGIGTLVAGSAWGAGAVAGLSATYGTALASAVYVAGSVLINKVLGPKPPRPGGGGVADTAYSLAAPRNRVRAYEPLGLLFGSTRVAPDLISRPYTWFEGDEQFVGMTLSPGINVGRVEALQNGESPLSSYEGVRTWFRGFPQMPDEAIPLYSNADVIEGAQLLDTGSDAKHVASPWVERTSSAETLRLQVNVEFRLWDTTSKGKDKDNREQLQIQYRPVGTTNWQLFGNYNLVGRTQKARRVSYGRDVELGQYDVRVRVAGQNTDGSGAQANFTWTTLVSVQRDDASHAGIPAIGLQMKASGQLNGTPDEIRCVAHSRPIPVWKGDAVGWVTEETSNPGAQILAYVRGINDENGKRIAGLGMADRRIDIESLKAFMLHCADNALGYDYWLTEVRSHQAVLDAIALAGFGQVTWAKGRLGVAWAADEQPLSGVVNMATIKKGQFQVDYTLANAADGIEYSYLDRRTWKAATLRVPAPGVEVMLNPAKITGEGVSTEAHAAMLARWHLAQSVYQYKSISYSTDIEHLAYSRLSVLALQHDLTQWGFGGRLIGATVDAEGVTTLQLDEPVPPPAVGSAFIGLRIPGERVYRVLRVVPGSEPSDTLVLADPWPADASLPGSSENNPAHDTIWIYDFKQTPGTRVRVTGIRPEGDLKGASVDVVQEGPAFWHYVRTGQYVPPSNESSLQTRPIASNLKVIERQVSQGGSVHTELQASFDISGPVGDTLVLSDPDGNAALEEVARTTTRSASWSIPGAGTYPVVVRPYSPEGRAGVAVSIQYTTMGADAPPVLVDLFDIEELSGGVRRYVWGFFSDTVQSTDFAGVEIRYTAGSIDNPLWEQMTPLGDAGGFFTAAIEAVLPASGSWTFACRSRNTSGVLSTAARYVRRSLGRNVGQTLEGIGGVVESVKQDLGKEITARIDNDLANATQAAEALRSESLRLQGQITESATHLAQQAGQLDQQALAIKASTDGLAREVLDRAAGDLNTRTELTTAVSRETSERRSDVENLTRMVSQLSAGSGVQFDSKRIWYFDSSVEGWGANGGSPTLVAGWLRPANHASDAFVTSPRGQDVQGAAHRFVKLRIRKVGSPAWDGRLLWNGPGQSWDDARMVQFAEPGYDSNGIATLDVDNIPWNGTVVDQIRLDLSKAQTDAHYFLLDWVAIGRPTPGASVAMLQDEASARIAADSSEASRRETLGVQLRGSYEGSDLAGVSQGLIAAEKSARLSGDQVNAQSIQALQARMPAGTGAVATNASVSSLQQAMVTADTALGRRVDSLDATMGDKVGSSAFNALKSEVGQLDGKVTTSSQDLVQLKSRMEAVMGAGSNLALNGDFNLGPEGWTFFNTTAASVVREGRGNSLCWKAGPYAGGANTVVSAAVNEGRIIALTAGRRYRVSCWTRTSEDFDGTADNTKLRIGDQNGNLMAAATASFPRSVDWVKTETFVNLPASGTVQGIKVTINRNGTAGTLWLDDLWVEEVTDADANASAITGLSTKVEQIDGKLTTAAEDVTRLASGIGNMVAYNIIANAHINAWPTGGPRASGVYRANGSIVAGMGANRGLRVGVINADNSISSTAVFDTYGNLQAESARFNAWYDETLKDNQYFIAYTSDAVGAISSGTNADTVGLRTRLLDAGLSQENLVALSGGRMLVMVGRRKSGAGGGRQILSPPALDASRVGMWVEMTITLLNGVPTGSQDSSALDRASRANAEALTGLRTDVGKLGTDLASAADSITSLGARIDTSVVSNDNLLRNSTFAGSAAWWTLTRTLPANTVEWVKASGQGGDALLMTHGPQAGQNPAITANDARWLPVAAGKSRRYRMVMIARAFDGATATLVCRLRVRTTGVGESHADVTLNLTDGAWKTYTAEWSTGLDRNEVMPQVHLTNANGKVLFDRVEFYDITDAQDIAGNATAISNLRTDVVQLGDRVTSSATNVVKLQSDVQSILNGSDSLFPLGSFETFQDGQLLASAAGTIYTARADARRTGERGLDVNVAANTSQSTNADMYVGQWTPITGNRRIYVEYYARLHPDSIQPTGGSIRVGWQTTNEANAESLWPLQAYALASLRKDAWTKVSGYMDTAASAAKWRMLVSIPGGNGAREVGVRVQVDDIRMIDVTDAYAAQQSAAATATAVTALTTKVDQQGTRIDAQAQQVTDLSSSLKGVLNTGSGLLPNPDFAEGLGGWTASAAANGAVWSTVNGDGRPGVLLNRYTSVNPTLQPNGGKWVPINGARRLRVVVRACGAGGANNLMVRMYRRSVAGQQSNQDLRAVFAVEAFETRTFDFDAFNSGIDAWRLNVYAYPDNGQVRVDSVQVYDITDQLANDANASAISGLSTSVAQQGSKLDTTARDLTQLKTQVGDVSASGFSQLKSQVSQQGTQLTALSGRVDGVQASLGGKADAAVVTSMQAQVRNLGSGGNLLMNTTFPFWQRSGWGWGSNPNARWSELGNPTGDDSWHPQGIFGLGAVTPGIVAAGEVAWWGTEYDIAIEGGKTYCASAWINTHRVEAKLEMTFFDASGNHLGLVHSPGVRSDTGTPITLDRLSRTFLITKAPATASFARFRVIVIGTGGDTPYFWLFRPMLSQVDAAATTPPTWSAGGTESSAQWSVNVRADGRVGGVQLASNGLVSRFDVVADAFSVSAPGGGRRTEYSDGNWRVFDEAGRLRVRMGVW
ncbi:MULTISPECIES: host specificity factor TipJ family phage tail protein [Stenotrophomonas]|uniref:Phage tail protein n=1 Tax=Stenotrophomonas lactitubi TaxID=2045214 RepID=A0AAW4GHV4_9GAMM|nr:MULTISPECIES: host specificity factor TipJ family phage tail protein [Stenotrophomonas]MBM9914353.1 phage tail protein [Stenotrophomonas lactitubi]MBM9921746.1 phage tail protein [Stenotrophomonas lactitubi]MBM9940152.1 phage tail protein [Stenotrophomonas lactitubi]